MSRIVFEWGSRLSIGDGVTVVTDTAGNRSRANALDVGGGVVVAD